jgi:hypothetical protein
MVNRIWAWHFGQGLVSTPNDFGKMGSPPSNGELLDWLAAEFVTRGWSIKHLHRLIMSSATYCQSSAFLTSGNARIDPENRFLWRMNRRRLEAEVLWDAVHSVAGTLNLKMGGRPVMPPLTPEELTDKANWVASADPLDHCRRGVYVIVRRNFRFPLFDVFDAPVNAVSCPARDCSTVALQGLWFLNNQTAHGQSEELAARLVKEAGPNLQACVDRAWRLAVSRAPTSQETQESLALLASLEKGFEKSPPAEKSPAALHRLPPARAAALTRFCLALFNLNEFIYID